MKSNQNNQLNDPLQGKQILKVQGDVFFIKINQIEPGERVELISEDGKYIIRKGELTGHVHYIDEIDNVKLLLVNGIMYVLVNDRPVKVKHQEHKPITLEPGVWRVGVQREFDPFAYSINRIKD
ncbi:hypothetical protein JGI3_02245 [Candidatus Kryptobacter tengchongensis]|nr:hypothetical protein JGI3_02245 [Candidatus Kryptobacter tengchongensis]